MSNGVRQGAILSAIAYCFYCEELFSLLKSRRAGCWVLDNYHGIFGYSDDNWLLAPSLSSLQDMLSTCEEYAATHNQLIRTWLSARPSSWLSWASQGSCPVYCCVGPHCPGWTRLSTLVTIFRMEREELILIHKSRPPSISTRTTLSCKSFTLPSLRLYQWWTGSTTVILLGLSYGTWVAGKWKSSYLRIIDQWNWCLVFLGQPIGVWFSLS